ncbi:hypothetical protein [Limnohabitans sp.]|uniref:hypothetical protein n=1 Tax=Limnohabitans sp. TaxID=1907725 RepID=UPI00286ED305|nr:hypothetical protein [Limnohabitans sp.]
MTSSAAYLKQFYDATKAMGDSAITSDAMFEIEGFETIALLTPQFPMPVLTTFGEIELPGPLGTMMYQPQQTKIAHQGSVTLKETRAGHINDTMLRLLSSGRQGVFNAKIYEGTPENFYRAFRLYDCFFQLENPDRNWEDRSQPLKITGTLFFHYFGEVIPGNVSPTKAIGS